MLRRTSELAAAGLLLVVVSIVCAWLALAALWELNVARARASDAWVRVAELELELEAPGWCDCALERAVAEDLAYVNERLAHGCAGLDWARRVLTLDVPPASLPSRRR